MIMLVQTRCLRSDVIIFRLASRRTSLPSWCVVAIETRTGRYGGSCAVSTVWNSSSRRSAYSTSASLKRPSPSSMRDEVDAFLDLQPVLRLADQPARVGCRGDERHRDVRRQAREELLQSRAVVHERLAGARAVIDEDRHLERPAEAADAHDGARADVLLDRDVRRLEVEQRRPLLVDGEQIDGGLLLPVHRGAHRRRDRPRATVAGTSDRRRRTGS